MAARPDSSKRQRKKEFQVCIRAIEKFQKQQRQLTAEHAALGERIRELEDENRRLRQHNAQLQTEMEGFQQRADVLRQRLSHSESAPDDRDDAQGRRARLAAENEKLRKTVQKLQYQWDRAHLINLKLLNMLGVRQPSDEQSTSHGQDEASEVIDAFAKVMRLFGDDEVSPPDPAGSARPRPEKSPMMAHERELP
jgi:predicted RNase H-like nuclease (RuvC/YqgF family)